MSDGFQKTGDVLARSRNRALLPVLAAGLRSSSAEIRAATIRATIRRVDSDSHTQLIRQFADLDEADQAALCEAHRAMPHHAAPTIKNALHKGGAILCENACRIILLCQDYDLFPALVKAAEDPTHRHASHITTTILKLAAVLHDDLAKWAAEGDRTGRDPSFARHQVLAALERSLNRRVEAHRPELVDAFLLLAPSDNATLRSILRDGGHPCHAQAIASFSTSQTPAIMVRLVALLRDTDAPASALEAISRRCDRPFIDFMLHELKHPVPLRVLHNMKRLRSVAWLESHRDVLLELDGRAQAVAVDLAMASEIDCDALFELLKLILKNGLAEGRRASCQGLARFDRAEANELVLAALNDPDGAVQAAAVRQLRPRRVPNALQMLVARLDSPSTEVRDAARSSLAEFNFVRYRAMFDLLDEDAVRTTGMLVRQVDRSAQDKLIEELTSPSITAQLRGIEMTVAMEATEDVCEQLIELARHENAVVRQEAVTALAYAARPGVAEALESAAHDTNRSVADAARHSLALRRLSGGERPSNYADIGSVS